MYSPDPCPSRSLRFTPYAWAKFLWFCQRGPSEIGAFGISDPDDLLLITDVEPVAQDASVAGVTFHDEAVADHFDDQVDLGRHPEQFARIWLHTHPGSSPEPSGVDETTFSRVFGACQWAVMAILARGGDTYGRLRFNLGPGGDVPLAIAVDFGQPFAASDHDAWEAVYQKRVMVQEPPLRRRTSPALLNDEELIGSPWMLGENPFDDLVYTDWEEEDS